MLTKYGVWKEKEYVRKKYMGIERTTFVIDETGKIKSIFNKVKVDGHTDALIFVVSIHKVPKNLFGSAKILLSK